MSEALGIIAVLLLLAVLVVLVVLVRRQGAGPSGDAMGLLAQQVGQASEHQAAALDRLAGQVGERLSQAATLSQEQQKLVTERLAAADKTIGDLKGQLGRLAEATQTIVQVGTDVRKLQDILQAPKLRGNLGEWSLETLLGEVLPAGAYEMQHRFGTGVVVDALVRLANGSVAIDAKFPLANFQKVLEATGDDERGKARKAFLRDVRGHVDAIAGKYIVPGEGTLDFAMMYVPAENVYYELLQPAEGLDMGAYARERKVVPVSPNTLYAYLMVVALGLRGLQIERNAQRIYGQLGDLAKELGRFTELYALVGRHLGNAHANYDESRRRLEMLSGRLEQLHMRAEETEEEDRTID